MMPMMRPTRPPTPPSWKVRNQWAHQTRKTWMCHAPSLFARREVGFTLAQGRQAEFLMRACPQTWAEERAFHTDLLCAKSWYDLYCFFNSPLSIKLIMSFFFFLFPPFFFWYRDHLIWVLFQAFYVNFPKPSFGQFFYLVMKWHGALIN